MVVLLFDASLLVYWDCLVFCSGLRFVGLITDLPKRNNKVSVDNLEAGRQHFRNSAQREGFVFVALWGRRPNRVCRFECHTVLFDPNQFFTLTM